jgi:hypothetical protein
VDKKDLARFAKTYQREGATLPVLRGVGRFAGDVVRQTAAQGLQKELGVVGGLLARKIAPKASPTFKVSGRSPSHGSPVIASGPLGKVTQAVQDHGDKVAQAIDDLNQELRRFKVKTEAVMGRRKQAGTEETNDEPTQGGKKIPVPLGKSRFGLKGRGKGSAARKAAAAQKKAAKDAKNAKVKPGNLKGGGKVAEPKSAAGKGVLKKFMKGGKVAGKAAGGLTKGLLKGASRLVGGAAMPVLSGLLEAAEEYAETGNKERAAHAGVGAGAGTVVGGVVGSALGPIGTFAGMAAGGIIGGYLGREEYDYKNKQTKKRVRPGQKNAVKTQGKGEVSLKTLTFQAKKIEFKYSNLKGDTVQFGGGRQPLPAVGRTSANSTQSITGRSDQSVAGYAWNRVKEYFGFGSNDGGAGVVGGGVASGRGRFGGTEGAPNRRYGRQGTTQPAPGGTKNMQTTAQQNNTMKQVYKAFRAAGYSDKGAKAMVAEVGRENSFNPNLIFGTHIDPHNGAINAGLFSYQGSRRVALMKHLQENGAIGSDGKIIRNQKTLEIMAGFTAKEMKSRGETDILEYLKRPDADPEVAAGMLGRRHILWRMDDPRYAHHNAYRRGYYNRIDRLAGPDGQDVDKGGDNKPFDYSGPNRVIENQLDGGKIRNQPIQGTLKNQLNHAASEAGVHVEVASGGQDAEGPHRTGSHRHDHGGAADVRLFKMVDGRKQYLDMRNPEDAAVMEKFTRESVRAGATGVGAGMKYMGPHTIHIGGGHPAHWGGADWVGRAREEGERLRVESPVRSEKKEESAKIARDPDRLARDPELPEKRASNGEKSLTEPVKATKKDKQKSNPMLDELLNGGEGLGNKKKSRVDEESRKQEILDYYLNTGKFKNYNDPLTKQVIREMGDSMDQGLRKQDFEKYRKEHPYGPGYREDDPIPNKDPSWSAKQMNNAITEKGQTGEEEDQGSGYYASRNNPKNPVWIDPKKDPKDYPLTPEAKPHVKIKANRDPDKEKDDDKDERPSQKENQGVRDLDEKESQTKKDQRKRGDFGDYFGTKNLA